MRGGKVGENKSESSHKNMTSIMLFRTQEFYRNPLSKTHLTSKMNL